MIYENRHAIKQKLNYEIKEDIKLDFRYMQTDHVHLKMSYKIKKPTLATESWEHKKEVPKN